MKNIFKKDVAAGLFILGIVAAIAAPIAWADCMATTNCPDGKIAWCRSTGCQSAICTEIQGVSVTCSCDGVEKTFPCPPAG